MGIPLSGPYPLIIDATPRNGHLSSVEITINREYVTSFLSPKITCGYLADYIHAGTSDGLPLGSPTEITINSAAGDDTIEVGDVDYKIYAGTGNDFVSISRYGSSTIYGDAGDDTVDASRAFAQQIIYGGIGKDTLIGGAGNDKLFGGAGKDMLIGGDGNDKLTGGAGNDALFGDSGNDRLIGGAGDDILYGGAGSDTLFGGAGNDTIVLGGGDTANGGEGNNTFVFDAQSPRSGFVTIFGFDPNLDRLDYRVFGEGVKEYDLDGQILLVGNGVHMVIETPHVEGLVL